MSTLYIKKFARKLAQYNIPGQQLPAYFEQMLPKEAFVRIAEIGAGPINTIGHVWPGKHITVVASDILQPEYEKLWQEHKATPVVPIEYQDMENLSYPDESFDIVHCVNAIDHTKDARKAIAELERICKKGGWVYLRHSSNQKKRFRGHHYWNIDHVDLAKSMKFSNDSEQFFVDKYTISWEYDKEPHDESKTLITAIWQKT